MAVGTMSNAQGSSGGPSDGSDDVSFGFRKVERDARQGLVNGVFSSVAGQYDMMNDLMSGGLHRVWKDAVITRLAPPTDDRAFHLLDVAGGTGDVAARFLRRGGSGCRATICDINAEMLQAGAERFAGDEIAPKLTRTVGNAECLPLPDRSVDAYTIAFGIRNVTDIPQALREARRVLKIGGRFLCLEFSHVDTPMVDQIYERWSFDAIPEIGQMVSGDRDSYQYLVESIRRFPKQEPFAAMLREAGFDRVSYENFTFGVVAVHSGWKL